MSLYKVVIRSRGRGWADERITEGSLCETGDGLRLNYSLDGDECVLYADPSKAVQERRGEQCVRVSFEEGKYTDCVIGVGGEYGSYKIFTRKSELLRGKHWFGLSLEYESGTDKELIKLDLTAYGKEKK